MSVIVIGVVFTIIVIISISIIGQHRYEQRKTNKPVKGDELPIWPFISMPIMTDTEVIFFKKLQQAVPEYPVFVQVQLSRIIEASDEAESKSFWFNRISRQSVDYVLIGPDLQTTLLAIELDDWTHTGSSREKADAKKDKALASAGIPILRFHAEKMPSVTILRHDIEAVLRQYPRY